MLRKLLILLVLLVAIGSQATANVEDGPWLNRQFGYVCDGQTFVLIKNKRGWGLLNEPDIDVSTTYDGFLLTDRETGLQRSLGTSASGADVMYVYYKSGTRRYDCAYVP